ncbi:hypothetical protein HOY80DRAFT_662740 [Tuber brumale]|nr:hypothetical protein HOY80DRAFT_662740 [Tuber brumale]
MKNPFFALPSGERPLVSCLTASCSTDLGGQMGKRRGFGRMTLRKIAFLPFLLYPLVGTVGTVPVRVLYPGMMNCVVSLSPHLQQYFKPSSLQAFKPSHLTVPFVKSDSLQGGLTQLPFAICLKRGDLEVPSPSGRLSCLPLASTQFSRKARQKKTKINSGPVAQPWPVQVPSSCESSAATGQDQAF